MILHERVMPYMTSPLMLSDFLTESYNIGKIYSLKSVRKFIQESPSDIT